MIDINILNKLNAGERSQRLRNLADEVKKADFPKENPLYINNHVHTTYSFSPYSPAAAVYAAKAEGLATVGIVDHDTLRGAAEFIEAGKIAHIPVTVGMECRVKMTSTTLSDRRTNNPDQTGVSYMTLQGIPHGNIDKIDSFFVPLREKRNIRNRLMCQRISDEISPIGISLDFDKDVVHLSMAKDGGSITERHLMLALARKLREGESDLADSLKALGVNITENQLETVNHSPFGEYTLLGILKSAFVKKIFIPADEECPELADVVSLAREYGAILCYAYLGDVTQSVTGDKAAQKFEDDYLDELFSELDRMGVGAVTYMPTRNTRAQLERVRALCDKYKMMQVSGEDINSPSQSFVIKAMEDPMFANLVDSTWALIRNESVSLD